MFGGCCASHRRQAFALAETADSGWFTSWAIDAASSPMGDVRQFCLRFQQRLLRLTPLVVGLLAPLDFRTQLVIRPSELAGPFLHAPFQFVTRALERLVGVSQLGGARQRDHLREQLKQQNRRDHRRERGNRLDDSCQPICAVPERPDLHQMRGAASEDEQAEHQEHPVEGQIGAPADEVDQRKRDQVVADRDHAVRYRVEPDDLRVPQKADAVWHEIRSQQFGKKLSHVGLSVASEDLD
jgi:hypothetical protein